MIKRRQEKGPIDITGEIITFPTLFYAVDRAAARQQAAFLRSRSSELLSLILAAAFGLDGRYGIGAYGPAISVAFFVLALFIRASGVGAKAEKRWYDARAAAESIKSLSWVYSMRADGLESTDSRAVVDFSDSLSDILKLLPDLDVPAESNAAGAVTSEMIALRKSSLGDREPVYTRLRVDDQISWYGRKAKWNRARAKVSLRVIIAIEVAGVILGSLRALGVFDVDWLSLVAVAAAAASAWQQTKNYTSLSEAYSVTSHEIALVKTSLMGHADEESWSRSVHDAETAFSKEHTLWLARKTTEHG